MPNSPAQALISAARGGIIKPGPGLIRAAQPLASPKRALGKYPYQFSGQDAGPNSSIVLANDSVAIPAATVAAPLPIVTQIWAFEVPEGMRCCINGIVLNAFTTDWNEGSGDLVFTLQVKYSTGPRAVEFLSNVKFGLGSNIHGPYPLTGRLEFAPLDVITATVTNVNLPTPAANDYAYAILSGYLYPTSESI